MSHQFLIKEHSDVRNSFYVICAACSTTVENLTFESAQWMVSNPNTFTACLGAQGMPPRLVISKESLRGWYPGRDEQPVHPFLWVPQEKAKEHLTKCLSMETDHDS